GPDHVLARILSQVFLQGRQRHQDVADQAGEDCHQQQQRRRQPALAFSNRQAPAISGNVHPAANTCATSSLWRVTPVFWNRLRRWKFTVATETPSASATASERMPWAIRRATRASLRVRPNSRRNASTSGTGRLCALQTNRANNCCAATACSAP